MDHQDERFLALALLLIILPTIEWIGEHKRAQAALWDAWPLISAVLVGLKMTAAAWIATALYSRRLLSDRTLLTGAAGWMIAVLAFIGLPVMLALGEAVSFHIVNRNNGSIVSSGEFREYLLYVPSSYDRTRATPLVISLHGGAMWPAAQMATSEWNAVADREGFLVVYPSGVAGDGPGHWRMGGTGMMKEVRFISELIDTLSATYHIDPARIYADGLSNGGGMAFVLSCTLVDRIAAVGMVAAAHLAPWTSCIEPAPMPMIAFHGTADTATPYHGGKSWTAPRPFPDIPTWTANWARRNRCASSPVASAPAADVSRLEYTGCAGDAAVVLYTIEGGGHTWPGGGPLPEWFAGPTSHGIDASSEMWAFFRQHRLPKP